MIVKNLSIRFAKQKKPPLQKILLAFETAFPNEATDYTVIGYCNRFLKIVAKALN